MQRASKQLVFTPDYHGQGRATQLINREQAVQMSELSRFGPFPLHATPYIYTIRHQLGQTLLGAAARPLLKRKWGLQ